MAVRHIINNNLHCTFSRFPQPYIDNEFDISWLYDEIATLWQTWLPADVAQSIMYSAYYAAEVTELQSIVYSVYYMAEVTELQSIMYSAT